MEKDTLTEATKEEIIAFDKELKELVEKHNGELKLLPFIDEERKMSAQLIFYKKTPIVETTESNPEPNENIPSPFINGTEPDTTETSETA